MKSDRNKTIDISVEEGQEYLEKCIELEYYSNSIENLLNKTIHGNFFEIVKYLPNNFADLIIIDPPYNLTKNFHGFTFKKSDNDTYLEYTIKYLSLIYPLLKETGSIYICSDW